MLDGLQGCSKSRRSKGRGPSEGLSSSRLAVQGHILNRAKIRLFWKECPLSDLQGVSVKIHTFFCLAGVSLGVKILSLTPMGSGFPLQIPKGKIKEKKEMIHHQMYFIYFWMMLYDDCFK